ncbi:MAG: hypothetical protein K6F22_06165 [Prevotella sp.]|nr:hypothetical protein [Prevotella sp.]
MKKILAIAFALLLVGQPAHAQFWKKIFKKKAKTEKKATVKSDGIDDLAQTALADITIADNEKNRNAFTDIPIGIKADRFEKLLMEKGFSERQQQGPHTSKSYIYSGELLGEKATVTLAVSDQTDRVYAVDVAEEKVYSSEAEVVKRFQTLKDMLVKTYGKGFISRQGEAYNIISRLGTVCLHYERGAMSNSYTIGVVYEDAKAYRMAYYEMSDTAYEEKPRVITQGLAAPCMHTDIVGLSFALSGAASQQKAVQVLKKYEYAIGRITAKVLPASFQMPDYKVSVTMGLRRKRVISTTIVANDEIDAVRQDLQREGYVTSDHKTYRQGKKTVTLSTNKENKVVLTIK